MKSTKIAIATILGTALLGVAATAAARLRTDHYPGSMCHQMWTSSERVHRADGALYNPSSTSAVVTCPLTLADGNEKTYRSVSVYVRDTEATADVSCRLVSTRSGLGTVYGPWVGSGTRTVADRWLHLGATPLYHANSITCEIPGNPASAHFIFSYAGSWE